MIQFELPAHKIAQTGAEPRDSSRLMVMAAHGIEHRRFWDLPSYLQAGDVLVFNESKVIPARLVAQKPTGGKLEVLLLREHAPLQWSAYLKPARRAGEELYFGDIRARITGQLADGARMLTFDTDIKPHLDTLGRLPLPPYIHEEVADERYQTVYARQLGSVAAPTAGLHFTPELLAKLDDMGVERHTLSLHVGAGTFKPITGEISEHVMHQEVYEIPQSTADSINRAKAEGRRIVAVGTTTVRALESAWDATAKLLRAGVSETEIFIYPPYTFGVPDLMITNFHLPNSTLLLLVSAFAGTEVIDAGYQTALNEDYRFYSLGDAMLLYAAQIAPAEQSL